MIIGYNYYKMGKIIEDKITKITEEEACYYLREVWNKMYNEYPSKDSLALLWAQWALESGRGFFCHCYNWGNIKKVHLPDDGHDWCMFRCNEILNGKAEWFDPPHPQTHFRAYPSPLEGAFDYVNFLANRKRYKPAWEEVKKGDPIAFSHQLKVCGYYTASESLYTKGIVRLTNEFKKKYDKLIQWKPKLPESPSESMEKYIDLKPIEIITIPNHIEKIKTKSLFEIIIDLLRKIFRLF